MSDADEIARDLDKWLTIDCRGVFTSSTPKARSARIAAAIRAATAEIEADRDRLAKEVERMREAHQDVISFCQHTDRMVTWDAWRKAIAGGNKGSWPRDGYEATLDYLCDISLSALNGVGSSARTDLPMGTSITSPPKIA